MTWLSNFVDLHSGQVRQAERSASADMVLRVEWYSLLFDSNVDTADKCNLYTGIEAAMATVTCATRKPSVTMSFNCCRNVALGWLSCRQMLVIKQRLSFSNMQVPAQQKSALKRIIQQKAACYFIWLS